jgi:hypothetical protein
MYAQSTWKLKDWISRGIQIIKAMFELSTRGNSREHFESQQLFDCLIDVQNGLIYQITG